eukprot:Nk52_evm57s2367 gene=Nk52_evmTU57s2367
MGIPCGEETATAEDGGHLHHCSTAVLGNASSMPAATEQHEESGPKHDSISSGGVMGRLNEQEEGTGGEKEGGTDKEGAVACIRDRDGCIAGDVAIPMTGNCGVVAAVPEGYVQPKEKEAAGWGDNQEDCLFESKKPTESDQSSGAALSDGNGCIGQGKLGEGDSVFGEGNCEYSIDAAIQLQYLLFGLGIEHIREVIFPPLSFKEEMGEEEDKEAARRGKTVHKVQDEIQFQKRAGLLSNEDNDTAFTEFCNELTNHFCAIRAMGKPPIAFDHANTMSNAATNLMTENASSSEEDEVLYSTVTGSAINLEKDRIQSRLQVFPGVYQPPHRNVDFSDSDYDSMDQSLSHDPELFVYPQTFSDYAKECLEVYFSRASVESSISMYSLLVTPCGHSYPKNGEDEKANVSEYFQLYQSFVGIGKNSRGNIEWLQMLIIRLLSKAIDDELPDVASSSEISAGESTREERVQDKSSLSRVEGYLRMLCCGLYGKMQSQLYREADTNISMSSSFVSEEDLCHSHDGLSDIMEPIGDSETELFRGRSDRKGLFLTSMAEELEELCMDEEDCLSSMCNVSNIFDRNHSLILVSSIRKVLLHLIDRLYDYSCEPNIDLESSYTSYETEDNHTGENTAGQNTICSRTSVGKPLKSLSIYEALISWQPFGMDGLLEKSSRSCYNRDDQMALLYQEKEPVLLKYYCRLEKEMYLNKAQRGNSIFDAHKFDAKKSRMNASRRRDSNNESCFLGGDFCTPNSFWMETFFYCIYSHEHFFSSVINESLKILKRFDIEMLCGYTALKEMPRLKPIVLSLSRKHLKSANFEFRRRAIHYLFVKYTGYIDPIFEDICANLLCEVLFADWCCHLSESRTANDRDCVGMSHVSSNDSVGNEGRRQCMPPDPAVILQVLKQNRSVFQTMELFIDIPDMGLEQLKEWIRMRPQFPKCCIDFDYEIDLFVHSNILTLLEKALGAHCSFPSSTGEGNDFYFSNENDVVCFFNDIFGKIHEMISGIEPIHSKARVIESMLMLFFIEQPGSHVRSDENNGVSGAKVKPKKLEKILKTVDRSILLSFKNSSRRFDFSSLPQEDQLPMEKQPGDFSTKTCLHFLTMFIELISRNVLVLLEELNYGEGIRNTEIEESDSDCPLRGEDRYLQTALERVEFCIDILVKVIVEVNSSICCEPYLSADEVEFEKSTRRWLQLLTMEENCAYEVFETYDSFFSDNVIESELGPEGIETLESCLDFVKASFGAAIADASVRPQGEFPADEAIQCMRMIVNLLPKLSRSTLEDLDKSFKANELNGGSLYMASFFAQTVSLYRAVCSYQKWFVNSNFEFNPNLAFKEIPPNSRTIYKNCEKVMSLDLQNIFCVLEIPPADIVMCILCSDDSLFQLASTTACSIGLDLLLLISSCNHLVDPLEKFVLGQSVGVNRDVENLSRKLVSENGCMSDRKLRESHSSFSRSGPHKRMFELKQLRELQSLTNYIQKNDAAIYSLLRYSMMPIKTFVKSKSRSDIVPHLSLQNKRVILDGRFNSFSPDGVHVFRHALNCMSEFLLKSRGAVKNTGIADLNAFDDDDCLFFLKFQPENHDQDATQKTLDDFLCRRKFKEALNLYDLELIQTDLAGGSDKFDFVLTNLIKDSETSPEDKFMLMRRLNNPVCALYLVNEYFDFLCQADCDGTLALLKECIWFVESSTSGSEWSVEEKDDSGFCVPFLMDKCFIESILKSVKKKVSEGIFCQRLCAFLYPKEDQTTPNDSCNWRDLSISIRDEPLPVLLTVASKVFDSEADLESPVNPLGKELLEFIIPQFVAPIEDTDKTRSFGGFEVHEEYYRICFQYFKDVISRIFCLSKALGTEAKCLNAVDGILSDIGKRNGYMETRLKADVCLFTLEIGFTDFDILCVIYLNLFSCFIIDSEEDERTFKSFVKEYIGLNCAKLIPMVYREHYTHIFKEPKIIFTQLLLNQKFDIAREIQKFLLKTQAMDTFPCKSSKLIWNNCFRPEYLYQIDNATDNTWKKNIASKDAANEIEVLCPPSEFAESELLQRDILLFLCSRALSPLVSNAQGSLSSEHLVLGEDTDAHVPYFLTDKSTNKIGAKKKSPGNIECLNFGRHPSKKKCHICQTTELSASERGQLCHTCKRFVCHSCSLNAFSEPPRSATPSLDVGALAFNVVDEFTHVKDHVQKTCLDCVGHGHSSDDSSLLEGESRTGKDVRDRKLFRMSRSNATDRSPLESSFSDEFDPTLSCKDEYEELGSSFLTTSSIQDWHLSLQNNIASWAEHAEIMSAEPASSSGPPVHWCPSALNRDTAVVECSSFQSASSFRSSDTKGKSAACFAPVSSFELLAQRGKGNTTTPFDPNIRKKLDIYRPNSNGTAKLFVSKAFVIRSLETELPSVIENFTFASSPQRTLIRNLIELYADKATVGRFCLERAGVIYEMWAKHHVYQSERIRSPIDVVVELVTLAKEGFASRQPLFSKNCESYLAYFDVIRTIPSKYLSDIVLLKMPRILSLKASYYENIARFLVNEDEYDIALTVARKMGLDTRPIVFEWGLCLLKLEKFDEAISQFMCCLPVRNANTESEENGMLRTITDTLIRWYVEKGGPFRKKQALNMSLHLLRKCGSEIQLIRFYLRHNFIHELVLDICGIASGSLWCSEKGGSLSEKVFVREVFQPLLQNTELLDKYFAYINDPRINRRSEAARSRQLYLSFCVKHCQTKKLYHLIYRIYFHVRDYFRSALALMKLYKTLHVNDIGIKLTYLRKARDIFRMHIEQLEIRAKDTAGPSAQTALPVGKTANTESSPLQKVAKSRSSSIPLNEDDCGPNKRSVDAESILAEETKTKAHEYIYMINLELQVLKLLSSRDGDEKSETSCKENIVPSAESPELDKGSTFLLQDGSLSLFASKKAQIELAKLALHRSGYILSQNIIDKFHLSVSDTYVPVICDFARSGQMKVVAEIFKFYRPESSSRGKLQKQVSALHATDKRNNATDSAPKKQQQCEDNWDRFLLLCIKNLTERHHSIVESQPQTLEWFLQKLQMPSSLFSGYAMCGYLKDAYLIAVKHEELGNIERLATVADRAGNSKIREMCHRYIANHRGLSSSTGASATPAMVTTANHQ